MAAFWPGTLVVPWRFDGVFRPAKAKREPLDQKGSEKKTEAPSFSFLPTPLAAQGETGGSFSSSDFSG